MQANQSPSVVRQRKNRLLAALCLAMIGLFILMGFAASGRWVQGVSEMKLSVEDPRPVAEAILKLQEKYGWVITYEDPLYVHDSEIADVTLKVRKDLDKYKPGEAPKVLVPKGGSLEFTYNVMSDTNIHVVLGAIPTNLFLQHRDQRGAANQRARDVLVDTLETMNNETKLSWRLLYEPGMKTFYLNPRKNTPSIAAGLDGDEFRIGGVSPTINLCYIRHSSLKLKFGGSGRKSAG